MQLPVIADVIRKRGDTKPIRFAVTDSDTGSDTALSGFTFKLVVATEKKPVDEASKLFEVIGTSPATGKIEFVPTTNDVDIVGTFYYDAQMIDGIGLIYTISEGKFKLTQDITKAES